MPRHCLTSFTAAALCRTFLKAKSQCTSAHVYYDKLMLSVDPALIPEWEEEMTNAEAVQLQHPEAMDYLKAKTVAATPSTNEQTDALGDGDNNVTAWFELAIQVEEIQCVYNHFTMIGIPQ